MSARIGRYDQKMKKLLVVSFLAALCLAQTGTRSGIDRSSLDTACKPCDDFWRYANGSFVDRNPIPSAYARWGTFQILRDANAERMKVILEAAAGNSAATGNERVAGKYYASCMNEQAIEETGAKPLETPLARIAVVTTVPQLVAEMVALESRSNINPVRLAGAPDLTDAKQVIAAVQPGSLSLPERDYYLMDDDRSKKIRAEFLLYAERMLVQLGDKPETAKAEAATILQFETALAEALLSNVENRDPYRRFHKMDLAALRDLSPAYDWSALFKALGVSETGPVNIAQPDYIKAFNRQLTTVPVDTWKLWLRWRLTDDRAQFLSKAFYKEWFHFRREILTGVTEQQPRWKVCALETDARLGDALGRLFVEKHFTAAARSRMNQLVENMRSALGEELKDAEWLDPETRKNAQRKLSAFDARIGYTDNWRDYSAVQPEVNTFAANVEAAAAANRRAGLAQIGHPVDRTRMGMTPPTVNASYSPPTNIITFPAGILQPPFFIADAEDAVNYGAIGAVIGHEMGHGFDDQGSKYDADGNLKNWWTDQDRARFEIRAACVAGQFDAIDVGSGLRHKGRLVTGEAMGDLGGLAVAYRAYHKSLNGKEAPVIDGFTGDQRFFLAFARVWGDQSRLEQQALQLRTDPHPLSKYRANATLQNMPEFHKAFGCRQGDPMVRPVDQQCRLW